METQDLRTLKILEKVDNEEVTFLSPISSLQKVNTIILGDVAHKMRLTD